MRTWILGARPRTLPAAVVPVALGASAAVGVGDDGIVAWRVVAALVVSLALQVGVNYANDYSDGVRGTDDVRVGPVRLVAGGLATPAAVKRAALLSFGVAAAAGLAIALDTSLWLLLVGAVSINFEIGDDFVAIESHVDTVERTGVEMEALHACSTAALTVYDMCKSADRGMVIGELTLWEKTGGRSGTYRRPDGHETSSP